MSEPDTADIVYRLKRNAESEDCFNDPYPDVLLDAAEEITRLRAALAEVEMERNHTEAALNRIVWAFEQMQNESDNEELFRMIRAAMAREEE